MLNCAVTRHITTIELRLSLLVAAMVLGCSSTQGPSPTDGPATTGGHVGSSSGGATSNQGGAGSSSGAGSNAGEGFGTGGRGSSDCRSGSGGSKAGTLSGVTPGMWQNITPPVELGGSHDGAGVMLIAIDPSNASTLYVGVEQDNGKGPPNGLWKTTDGGASWALLGSGSDADPWDSVTSYLDMPIDVAVDPDDANHLYVTSGVRGANQGFWVSTDGGETWIRPKGFNDTSPTHDVTTMSVDPCDFKHVLLSSHSDWAITAGYSSGVVESRDGGASWIVHLPPGDAWAAGTKGVAILHPSAQVGDADTWLVADEGGFWRTSNAGKDWSKVSTAGTPHGSNEFYYSAAGALYAGAFGHPQRSKDNGLTWQSLDQGLPNAAYYAVVGDGNTLYLQPDGYPPATGYLTSAETDGTNWVPYSDTTAPTRGPIRMAFDPVNRILYSANWSGGLWRLKVKSP